MTSLTSLQQVSVNVHDLSRAVAFYKDKLGVRHLFDAGPRMSFFVCEMGVRLMLAIPEKPEFDHKSSILYFKVADIQGAYEDLKRRGVAFREAPDIVARLPGWEVWMAFFDDSEGNLLAITSEIESAAA
jgi:predicted enzyme related to lactoylglutathione lyase